MVPPSFLLALLPGLPTLSQQGGVPPASPIVQDETLGVADSERGPDPAVARADAFIEGLGIDKSASGWRTRVPRPPILTFAPDAIYRWVLETNKGTIGIRLMPEVAPMHVSSTIYLTRLGFYDGLGFHRIIRGFMAQGGDPLGNGLGGPGYKYDGEFDPAVRHDRPGLLSMANAGPGTDGSQFFITFVPTPHLDDKHTIFGEVDAGMDVLRALEAAPTGAQDRPVEPLTIQMATIEVQVLQPLPSAADTDDPALKAMADFVAGAGIERSAPNWRKTLPRPPKLEFPADSKYYWNVRTNVGTIRIRLMPEVAPMHVSSTIYLARLGFYDGLGFHRVIPGFMAQGGCPDGRGTGSPGYRYDGEFSPQARHDRPGLLSMANAGPGTDGSQFFITFVPTPHLNDKHTIFGEVVEGMEVLKRLEQAGSSPSGRTSRPLVMEETTISLE